MKKFGILPAFIRLTFQRLAYRPVLALLALTGIVLAVGLLTSAAFFSQAVDRVLLEQELAKLAAQTGRPPFATRVYFLPSTNFPVSLANAELLGDDVTATLAAEVGLPVASRGLIVESGSLLLLPAPNDNRYAETKSHLTTINVTYVADVADHLVTVAGEPYQADAPVATEALDVWMHADLAAHIGAQAGESFQVAVHMRQTPRLIRIRGLWRARDPGERFWFNNPDTSLQNALLVTRQHYVAAIEPLLAAKSRFVTWRINLDEQYINPAQARRYADGFDRGMAIINQYLPGARLDVSPLEPLRQFVRRQSTLTLVLLGFNLPGLLFLLYFLVLIGMLLAQWQARETALLVSRGMGTGVVLGLTLVEEALLFVVGIPLGIGFGMLLAQGMGATVTFLQFEQRAPLPVSLQGINLPLLSIALGLALLARLAPLFGAARLSVVQEERISARALRLPLWQRLYLDVLLVAPTWYAYDQLAKRGTLALSAGQEPADLLQNPLLIVVPALFILTAALLSMRIFPWLMRLADLAARRTPSLALHLALRHLARHSHQYMHPLLLVVIALGMGVYTRSLADSLDQWLAEQVFYRVGADVTFRPLPPLSDGELVLPPDAVFIPEKANFLDVPGVVGVTRVGDYPARLLLSSREREARMLAIDREDFAQVAWFRSDLAAESLGGLMNELALAPENVLVSPQFLQMNQLKVGDRFNMRVSLSDNYRFVGAFRIAGVYDYFPTIEPNDLTVVGNLEHLFIEAGASFAHRIWFHVAPAAPLEALLQGVSALGISVADLQVTQTILADEQARLERVGIFGTLSLGFVAAAAMAIITLLVYSFAAMRARFYQFGVLRALGMSQREVMWQVIVEYVALNLYGSLMGGLVGWVSALLFVPFLRIPAANGAPPPPLLPTIRTGATVEFALAFLGWMALIQAVSMLRAARNVVSVTLRMGHAE